MSHRRMSAGVLAAVLTVLALAACESSPTAVEDDEETAAELLTRARSTLDGTSSVHFVLGSEGVPESATTVVGGEGDLARPSSFDGTLQVQALGQNLDLAVVSVDGTVYAELPFTSGFQEIDAAQFGFSDPGALLDPETGISRFLSEAEDAEYGDERRVDGEVVQDVTAQVPGEVVADLLANENPSEPVDAEFSIESETGELRRAQLTGPFYSADEDATYTLELSDFGADVDITAPTGG
jgi:hypothetical protein